MPNEVKYGERRLDERSIAYLVIQAALRHKKVVVEIDGEPYDLIVIPAKEQSNG